MRYSEIVEHVAATDFLPETLYHGTTVEFDAFDRGKARTAAHIYTSPDPATARYYGPIVYACHVRGPQADITDEGDYRLISRLVDEFADRFTDHVYDDTDLATLRQQIVAASDDPDMMEWEAEDDPSYIAAVSASAKAYAREFFADGKVYDYDGRGRFQDEVLSTIFDWGYRSIRFTDHSSAGESLSVVAENAEDIEIVGRVTVER